MKTIRDYINGNLKDAKKSAKKIGVNTLYNAAVNQYLMSAVDAEKAVVFLKGQKAVTKAKEKNILAFFNF